MKTYFILGFLIIINASYSQNLLSGKGLCSANNLILSEYYFNELTAVDTIKVSNNGDFSYNLSGKNIGQYNLKNKDINIDFLYNNESIELNYNCYNADSVYFKHTKENELLNSFFKFNDVNNTAYSLLNQLKNYYPKKEKFYGEIINKIKELNFENEQYIKFIIEKNDNSLASKIVNLYRYTNKGFVNNELYFDTILIKTRFLGDLIVSYLNNYENNKLNILQQEQAFFPAIDTILQSFSKNKLLTIQIANFLIDKFRYYDLELATEYTASKANKYIDKELKQNKYCETINNIINVEIGKKTPNFLIEKRNLYEIKSKYKLVIFWASWCTHCSNLMNDLLELDINPNVKIITYSLDFEKENWEKTIAKFNKDWLNLCFCNLDNSIPDKYAVYATPTMFLLDSNDIIIAKPKSIKEILDNIKDE